MKIENQLLTVEDSSLTSQEKYQEQIAELSSSEPQLKDVLQVMTGEMVQNETGLEAIRQSDKNKATDISSLLKQLGNAKVVVYGLMRRIDVVSARLKEVKELIAFLKDSQAKQDRSERS